MSSPESVPPPAIVITLDDGTPISSCCHAELTVKREVGPDVAVYSADAVDSAEGDFPKTLRVSFQKTYDGDGGDYEVSCSGCLRDIEIEVEES